MKIIISRKGFDSKNGGKPSAILPDGRLVPFPIPVAGDPASYGEVSMNGLSIGPLVAALTGGNIGPNDRCHLDPDLDMNSVARATGWRPAFGQIGSSQAHLDGNGVSVGDLFLFFGWFRRVEEWNGRWRYVRGEPDLHILYGWLRVGEIVRLGRGQAPQPRVAFQFHPHLQDRRDRESNTLYLAADSLGYGSHPGGGLFSHFSDHLVLTDTRQPNRSLWRLPAWMGPRPGCPPLSHHGATTRWTMNGDECKLQSVAIGQEFVLDCEGRPEADGWLRTLFEPGAPKADEGGNHPVNQPNTHDLPTEASATFRAYRYVVRWDKGFAPNPEGDFCTLACCKPDIRLTASTGDWIFGFASSRHGDARLVYAMQVCERPPFAKYWGDPRFEGRVDNIYCPDLRQIPNLFHGHQHIESDLRGKYVLISTPGKWWYFGKAAPNIIGLLNDRERGIRLWHRHTGHAFNGLLPGDAPALIAVLERTWPGGGRFGQPFDPSPSPQQTHQGQASRANAGSRGAAC